MRGIKFRSAHYNLKTNEFSHFSYWGTIDHKGDFSNDYFTSPSSNSSCYRKFEEQYTGLKDKNGVEIFEGDVVNVSGKPYLTEKATVVFGKKSFGFKIKCIVNDGYKDLYKYYGLESSSKLEVIGNIHETK